MIIIHCDEVNNISQDIYDRMTDSIDPLLLPCAHCHHTGTVKHAYYERRIKRDDESGFQLIVLRVQCQFCGKTHALIPDTIVPYSSIPLTETIHIILAESTEVIYEILSKNLELDLSDVYRIRRNYRLHWKERLLSFSIEIDSMISRHCVDMFHRQFMQIHRTPCAGYG